MFLIFCIRLRRLLKVLNLIMELVVELYLMIVVWDLFVVIWNFFMIDLMNFFCCLKSLVEMLLDEFSRKIRFVW